MTSYIIRFRISNKHAKWIADNVYTMDGAIKWLRNMLVDNYSLLHFEVEKIISTATFEQVPTINRSVPLLIPESKMFDFK